MKNIKPLSSIIEDPATHKKFISSVTESIEKHIQSMGAIKGLVVKKTYAAVKAFRPGYVEHILEVLSKDYVREFSDLHEQYRKDQHLPAETVTSLPDYMKSHQQEAEQKFWIVADQYAARKANSFIGKTFQTFRPTIKNHLPTALDMIFKIIES